MKYCATIELSMEAHNDKKPYLLTEPMIAMYEKGFSTKQIGEKYNIGKSSVAKRLKKAGINLRLSKDYSGKDRYWLWKGDDYMDKIVRKRNQRVLRKWSKSIMERDNYICQDCGAENVKFHAHHLVILEECIGSELEFDTKNGVTLCIKCHRQRHKK